MKLSNRVRALYAEQLEVNRMLKKFVDDILESIRVEHPTWHYFSRLKGDQSFALKLQTGRGYLNEKFLLEDFFACSIIVENYDAIDVALQEIEKNFTIKIRRPESHSFTHNRPENFSFDDLRLYCTIKEIAGRKENILQDVIFEVQIKTFLQHAWGIATHDLIYKSNNVSWGKARIAYQVKAMLEHAELSIKQAQLLSDSQEMCKEYKEYSLMQKVIELISKSWEAEFLPKDMKRLAENIILMLKAIRREKEIETLEAVLQKNQNKHPRNMSPYNAIVQYMVDDYYSEMVRYLTKSGHGKLHKIFIDVDVVFPASCDVKSFKNAIFLEAR